jgi:hypothetical protein
VAFRKLTLAIGRDGRCKLGDPLSPSWRGKGPQFVFVLWYVLALGLHGLVRDIPFMMGVVEYESVESLLLALTNFSAADIAKCSPDLIEKARRLLQSVPVRSPASPPRPQGEEGLVPVTVPSSAPPPRPQGEEDPAPITVPSSASPPKPQGDEGPVPTTVPSSASPPKPQGDEGPVPTTVPSSASPPKPQGDEGPVPTTVPSSASPPRLQGVSVTASEPVPLSKEHAIGPVDANTAIVETKAKEVFEALLKAIKETKDLLKQDVKRFIRGGLSPAAHDPHVQDLEACIGNRPSNARKLRHIIVLPKWLKEYEDFDSRSRGRGPLATFSAERGLAPETAKEALSRARQLRAITKHYGKSGLEAPLGLIVSKWKRLTKEVRLAVARLCRGDRSVSEALPALSKFYEECDAEYTLLLDERLAAICYPGKFLLLALETYPDRIRSQMHPEQAGGFVEDAEVEEPPIDGEYGFAPGHEDGRLSTKGVSCELSTTDQHGTKRSFEAFEGRAPETHASSQDVPLPGMRPLAGSELPYLADLLPISLEQHYFQYSPQDNQEALRTQEPCESNLPFNVIPLEEYYFQPPHVNSRDFGLQPQCEQILVGGNVDGTSLDQYSIQNLPENNYGASGPHEASGIPLDQYFYPCLPQDFETSLTASDGTS